MSPALFYTKSKFEEHQPLSLDEATSKHIAQVLRMQVGEKIRLTNGLGTLAEAEIIVSHKKASEVKILSTTTHEKEGRKVGIAISPVKNASRFEWFLEKATELGVTDIYPLLCHRTEREHFRHDRMNAICISAMLQSQQAWLPILHQPIAFDKLITASNQEYKKRWIAHCEEDGEKKQLSAALNSSMDDALILIGPEGDFTNDEIATALTSGYSSVALGNTRLRTETAGVVAATLLRLV
jgi:16S rRNA (uracil1498-N3)-methyltransferase